MNVGKLRLDTTLTTVRNHLEKVIKIRSTDIADILSLTKNRRNNNEASFCLSLNTPEAENKALDLNSWPEGVRVSKFYRQLSPNQNISPSYDYSDNSHEFREG